MSPVRRINRLSGNFGIAIGDFRPQFSTGDTTIRSLGVRMVCAASARAAKYDGVEEIVDLRPMRDSDRRAALKLA